MSMLKYYFEDDRDWHGNRRDWSYLFDGLKIMEAGESYLAHRGQSVLHRLIYMVHVIIMAHLLHFVYTKSKILTISFISYGDNI